MPLPPRSAMFQGTELGPLRQKFVRRCLGWPPRPGPADQQPATLGELLSAWTAELLQRLPFLDSEQEQALLEQLLPAVRQHGDTLAQLLESSRGAPATGCFVLTFIDGRYACWTGQRQLLALATGDPLPQLAQPGLETVAYNLTELCRRQWLRLQTPRGQDACDPLPATTSPAQGLD